MQKQTYRDYASSQDDPIPELNIKNSKGHQRKGPRGGVQAPFPTKLYSLLEENKFEDIISWQPHGRCFLLHRPKEFVRVVMPKYFNQSKLTSFQRQLNLYGFTRLLSASPDKGGYYHELFLRGKSKLCSGIMRTKVKGSKSRRGLVDLESEPKFYSMEPVPQSPCVSPNKGRRTRTAPALSYVSSSDSSVASHCSSSENSTRLDENIPDALSIPTSALSILSIPSTSALSILSIPTSVSCIKAETGSSDFRPLYNSNNSNYGYDDLDISMHEDELIIEALKDLTCDPTAWNIDFDLLSVFD